MTKIDVYSVFARILPKRYFRVLQHNRPTASVAGTRTARKLSRGKLPSHRWSLTVEFDPLLTVVAGPTRKLSFALLIVTGSHGVDSARESNLRSEER